MSYRFITLLLVLISDVSIVICRATFNTLSTEKDSWYVRIEYDQRKPTKPKPGTKVLPSGQCIKRCTANILKL